MKCDIIIPVWNELEFTRRCVESIRGNTRYPYGLILVDNKSDTETADYLAGLARSDKDIIFIRNNANLGFIRAANQGINISRAPYLCLMNNDTVATDGWLGRMVSLAESDSRIGLVNPRSESPGRLSLEEYSKRLAQNKGEFLETNQCMGFCMLIKREVIERVGYLDEAYGMGGFDDTDLSKRAHLAGYKCVCAKDAYVYHDWHTSFKKAGNREELVRRNEKLFFNKWGRYLRIGFPIIADNTVEYDIDINTSLGLAREWNWVHAWLNGGRTLNLPEHQSLRIFKMSSAKGVFYLEVLFRLLERRLKRKKRFDAVLVSDRNLFRNLSFFKGLFSAPLFYIGRDDFRYGDDEDSWRRRAKEIVELVKKRIDI